MLAVPCCSTVGLRSARTCLLAPIEAVPAAKGDVSGAPRIHLLERAAFAAGLAFRSQESKEAFDSGRRWRRWRLRDSGSFAFDDLSLRCREFGSGWHHVALLGVVGSLRRREEPSGVVGFWRLVGAGHGLQCCTSAPLFCRCGGHEVCIDVIRSG